MSLFYRTASKILPHNEVNPKKFIIANIFLIIGMIMSVRSCNVSHNLLEDISAKSSFVAQGVKKVTSTCVVFDTKSSRSGRIETVDVCNAYGDNSIVPATIAAVRFGNAINHSDLSNRLHIKKGDSFYLILGHATFGLLAAAFTIALFVMNILGRTKVEL